MLEQSNHPTSKRTTTIKGKLYLIPNTLGSEGIEMIPEYVQELVKTLDVYIVENVRNARRYLVKLGIKKAGKVIDDLTFHLIDKHAKPHTFGTYLEAAEKGQNIGLLSEAGCPAIADPGARIVTLAQKKRIEVVPMVGPSSILLALMASGLNGQNFAFCGYLPIQRQERIKRLELLESRAWQEQQTQIFMEAPYRNNALLASILQACGNDTLLSIATNLTLPNQKIETKPMTSWRRRSPDLHKQPTIFLIGTPPKKKSKFK